MENEQYYEPKPLQAEEFHRPGTWTNINCAPYDQVAGVTYKRAMNIKRVLYNPADAAPDMPEPWQGQGPAIIRWILSEQEGTEEHLLENRTFAFLHDVSLPPGSSTGQRACDNVDKVIYVISGEGLLYHRPTDGSPIVARPLRPGDTALVRTGEYHNLANEASEENLRLIILGVCPPSSAM